jgi:hypothetical protein
MHFLKTAGTALTLLAASLATVSAQEQPVGIPVCDNFIASYQTCVSTQVPEAQRPMFAGHVAQWRTSWRQLADNPQTRATLEQVCRQQIDAMRQSLQAYGCRF